jgi:hypothetical protein
MELLDKLNHLTDGQVIAIVILFGLFALSVLLWVIEETKKASRK